MEKYFGFYKALVFLGIKKEELIVHICTGRINSYKIKSFNSVLKISQEEKIIRAIGFKLSDLIKLSDSLNKK